MKSPAFQLYVRDVLCSRTFRQLHARRDVRGLAYLFLLCGSWLEEPPGTLPNDPDELADIARLSREEFAKFWPLVRHQFHDAGDGRLFHARLTQCWMQQESRKLRGRKGGEASGEARREAKHQANGEAEHEANHIADRERVADAEADAEAVRGKSQKKKGVR